MGWNQNAEKVISAALALEQQGRSSWTAAEVIAYLDDEEGTGKPSDATVYRLLHRFHAQLGFLASTIDEPTEAKIGRPRRVYHLTDAGLEAAASAARWLSHGGVAWARAVATGPLP